MCVVCVCVSARGAGCGNRTSVHKNVQDKYVCATIKKKVRVHMDGGGGGIGHCMEVEEALGIVWNARMPNPSSTSSHINIFHSIYISCEIAGVYCTES